MSQQQVASEISVTTKNDLLTSHILLQSSVSSFVLDSNITITDRKGRLRKLSEVSDSAKLIVYRISESDCLECIKSQLPYLKVLCNKIGKDHVLLLTSFSTEKAFKIFLDNIHIDICAYNIQSRDLAYLSIESLNVPYFFELNRGNTAGYVFIPRKEIPDLSDAYCKEIVRTF